MSWGFREGQETKMGKGTVFWAEIREKSKEWTVRDHGDPGKSKQLGVRSMREREQGSKERRQERRKERERNMVETKKACMGKSDRGPCATWKQVRTVSSRCTKELGREVT